MSDKDISEPKFNKILKDATLECDDYYQMLNRVSTWCNMVFQHTSDQHASHLAQKTMAQISNLRIRHGREQIIKF